MPAAFLSPLWLRDEGDGRRMSLLAPLRYLSAVAAGLLEVPAGFVTDFASIPRPLWAVLPPHGTYDRAAVVHDWLYQTPAACSDRSLADRVLLEAMEACGVGRLTRWAIYAGVRLGGAAYWARDRKQPA